MTLILSLLGRGSIFLCADRRLSYFGRPPRDDARKVLSVEAEDGVAIVGYAGLGMTGKGVEPADWMAAVLRGRNHPLVDMLNVVANAAHRQLPRHLIRMPKGYAAHTSLIPTIVGDEPRLYALHIELAATGGVEARWNRVANPHSSTGLRPPRIAACGSGAKHLFRAGTSVRELLRLIACYERGRIGPHAVADAMARANAGASEATPDKSVGPSCIVTWRNSKSRGPTCGGGGHQFYEGFARVNSPAVPTIARGLQIDLLAQILMRHSMSSFEAGLRGESREMDEQALNDELAQMPSEPDEDLK